MTAQEIYQRFEEIYAALGMERVTTPEKTSLRRKKRGANLTS